MRTIQVSHALTLFALLTSCVGNIATPSSSPTSTTSIPTPTPSASPSATTRSVRPFDRVVAIPIAGEQAFVAIDRERVALVEGTSVSVVDVATGQKRDVYQAASGWGVSLSSRGLRGDTLVLLESRIDGQRTDGRAIRIDLRANTRTTLDEWSGPFLGGGDTWNPEPPITNGTDTVWVRVTDETRPFANDVVLARGTAAPRVISTSTSPAWADLDDGGRIAVSTLITRDDLAELVIWRDGQVTSLGTRDSPQGGPARFVGDRLFWALSPGFVARIERGRLITVGGATQDIDLTGCSWNGATARHLAIACGPSASGTSTISLVDPATGTRDTIPGALNMVAGPRAAVWREGTQWWLGTLSP